VDSKGIVRGSSRPEQIGQPYRKIESGESIGSIGEVAMQRYAITPSSSMLDFEAPILFREKDIGRIHLGMHWDPLEELSRQIVFTMLLLMVVTVAAASMVAYALANAMSVPLQTLRKSLEEMKKGNFGYRIAQSRKDELGEVFRSFDEMAATLQKNNDDMIDMNNQKNNDQEGSMHGHG
jgi:serine/threonine-protein kinase